MTESILALDQGTTSSRAMLFDGAGRAINSASAGYRQIYPRPGSGQHDPNDILTSQVTTARSVIDSADDQHPIVAIGVTNQRETTIVWDCRDGRPVDNAIVWQDRRTGALCEA